MSDGWNRGHEHGSTRSSVEPSIDVPLAGDGPLAERPTGPQGDPAPPNWRRIIGLSSLAGIALGIIASVVLVGIIWNDDDPADGIAGDPSISIDEFDLATLITTPPTLDPPLESPPVVTAPPPSVALDIPALETYGTLPTYPRFTGIPEGGLDSFDLAQAVASFDDDVARRSTTHIETGDADGAFEITIVRDPVNNRYGLTMAGFGETREVVVDIDAGLTYVTDDDMTWVEWPNSGLIAGVSAGTIGAYFDGLLFGPIRPDTLPAATVEPLPMVFFEGTDALAREFAVELPGDLVPEWQFYALSPIAALPDGLRPERLNYLAYVDDGGNLGRVHGTAEIGDVTQLVIHQVDRLEFPEIVLTPDPARVVPRPTSSG